MTNLLEKSLLLGFSIFLLTIFSSLLIPFLNELADFNNSERRELDKYISFFDEINDAVLYVIDNPEESYLKNVDYPNYLNLTCFDYCIIFNYIIGQQIYEKVLLYNTSFYNSYFYNVYPQIYLLNVSFLFTMIKVNIINL